MRKLPVALVAAVVVCAAIAAAARPALGDIIVFTSFNNTGTENVLLNPATDVLAVTGSILGGHTARFTSTSGSNLLSASSAGQQPITGGTGNNPFTNISVALDGSTTFTRAVFNINAGTNGSVLIHVEGVNINGGFFEGSFPVDANGENPFTIHAVNGQMMTSITLTAIDGAVFEDLRQNRIGGMPIPEPVGGLLLGLALAGGAAVRRSGRRATR